MKTITNKLATGVKCSFNDKGGNIKVLSPYMTITYNKMYIEGVTTRKQL